MSIEGGARCGYVNPDEPPSSTCAAASTSPPQGEAWERAVTHWWRGMASDADAHYDDDRVELDGSALAPSVTWGINPGRASASTSACRASPTRRARSRASPRPSTTWACARASRSPAPPIDVAFIGSCTNGRISDLREAARVAKTGQGRARREGALVVPGSQAVARQAEEEGLPEIFRSAGFEWREAGCSMCLAMNPDKLVGREVCASSSNRNFKGRQGSPTGRTLLMSPAMVAAAAMKRRGDRRAGGALMAGERSSVRVEGRGCVLRGNDIDTDRIIPARFLRCVSFDVTLDR